MPRSKTAENVKEALANAPKNPPVNNGKDNTLRGLVNRMLPEVSKAIPKAISKDLPPERFLRITISALSQNPDLEKCTQTSFLAAMMQAAQLGLEPNTTKGEAYLIPYYNKSIQAHECQFQLGYKGLLNLVYRSNQIRDLRATAVYEKDEFYYSLGLHPDLVHNPSLEQDRGEPTHYYASFRTVNGGEFFEVMSVEEIKKHANQYSVSYKRGYNSPWAKNFDGMALKTVIKKALKLAPMSSDFARSIETDESIKHVSEQEIIENSEFEINTVDLPNEFDYEFGEEENSTEFTHDTVPSPEKDGQQTIL